MLTLLDIPKHATRLVSPASSGMIQSARILHSASECTGLVADRSIALAPYMYGS